MPNERIYAPHGLRLLITFWTENQAAMNNSYKTGVGQTVLTIAVYELCWKKASADLVCVETAIPKSMNLGNELANLTKNGLIKCQSAAYDAYDAHDTLRTYPPHRNIFSFEFSIQIRLWFCWKYLFDSATISVFFISLVHFTSHTSSQLFELFNFYDI